jgi:histidinol-phosphate aminotransferase
MQKNFQTDENFLDNIKPSVRKMEAYTVAGGQFAKIKLNQNENPFDFPAKLKLEILNEFYNESWNRYPDVFPNAVTERLAAFLNVPKECLIVSNGSNELIYTIFLATLSRGSSVLIPSPTFSLYEKVADVLEADVLKVAMKNDLTFDVPAIIEEAKRSRPRVVVLSTPNNPTSKSISLTEIEEIVSSVRSIVIVDEAYTEFSRQTSALGLIETHSNVIVMRTMSKAFSLAGLRLGYTIAQPALTAEILKPKIPFTTNRLAELTAIKILDNYDLVKASVQTLLAEREQVYGELKKIQSVFTHESDANFFIIEVEHPNSVFDALKSKSILVRNVSSYPLMSKCLRVNVGTPAENDQFLFELKAIFA